GGTSLVDGRALVRGQSELREERRHLRLSGLARDGEHEWWCEQQQRRQFEDHGFLRRQRTNVIGAFFGATNGAAVFGSGENDAKTAGFCRKCCLSAWTRCALSG